MVASASWTEDSFDKSQATTVTFGDDSDFHSWSGSTHLDGIFVKTLSITREQDDMLELVLCEAGCNVYAYTRTGSEEDESVR